MLPVNPFKFVTDVSISDDGNLIAIGISRGGSCFTDIVDLYEWESG